MWHIAELIKIPVYSNSATKITAWEVSPWLTEVLSNPKHPMILCYPHTVIPAPMKYQEGIFPFLLLLPENTEILQRPSILIIFSSVPMFFSLEQCPFSSEMFFPSPHASVPGVIELQPSLNRFLGMGCTRSQSIPLSGAHGGVGVLPSPGGSQQNRVPPQLCRCTFFRRAGRRWLSGRGFTGSLSGIFISRAETLLQRKFANICSCNACLQRWSLLP